MIQITLFSRACVTPLLDCISRERVAIFVYLASGVATHHVDISNCITYVPLNHPGSLGTIIFKVYNIMINNRDDNYTLIINRGLYVNVYQNWRFCSISSLSYLGVINRVGSLKKKYNVAINRDENDISCIVISLTVIITYIFVFVRLIN